MHNIHLAIIFLGSLVIFGVAQNGRIMIPPSSVNVTFNSIATFHCNVYAPQGLLWTVGGFGLHHPVIKQRGIEATEINDTNTHIINSTMAVPATEVNNNTYIVCIAVGIPSNDVAYATIRVQGFLDPPHALEIFATENSTIRLTWEEPWTLDITGVDPDITDFLICVNLTGCFNVSDIRDFTPGTTEYLLPYLCDPAEFNVSAWNGAGLGGTSNIIFMPGNVDRPTRIENITDIVSFEGDQPVVDLMVVEDGNCTDVFEVIFSSNSMEIISFPRMIPEVSEDGVPVLSFSGGIVEDETYTVTVMVDSADSFMDNTTLNTFDLQGEHITYGRDSVNVTCFFAEGSIDLGCYIVVLSMGVLDDDKTYRLYRDNTTAILASTASHTFYDLSPGTYQVNLYDIEEDDTYNLLERLYVKEVTILPLPPLPYSSLTPTRTIPTGLLSMSVFPSESPIIHNQENDVGILVSITALSSTSIIALLLMCALIVAVIKCQVRKKKLRFEDTRRPRPTVEYEFRYVATNQLQIQPFGVAEVPPGYQEHRTVSSQPVDSAMNVAATGDGEYSEESAESELEQDADDHDIEAQDGSSVTAMCSQTTPYADLGGLTKDTRRPKDQEVVQYSEVIPQIMPGTRGKQPKTAAYHNAVTTSITEQGPTLDRVYNQLKPIVDKWQDLGELLGVSETLLDETFTNIVSNDACLKEMLGIWLSNHDGPRTWNEVAEALQKMGKYQLGEHVHQIHATGMVGSPLLSPAASSPPIPPRGAHANVVGPSQTSSTLV